jgi:hypothetical protein
LPSIEEIEDSVAGTPAKPGIYSIINNKLNVALYWKCLKRYVGDEQEAIQQVKNQYLGFIKLTHLGPSGELAGFSLKT